MIVIIDNYDSFVYNLARYVSELRFKVTIYRNDQVTLAGIVSQSPSHIILSPGPCSPTQSGICRGVISACYRSIPILGVCLGHQAIAQAFGARIGFAKKPMHGKSSLIMHNNSKIFENLARTFVVGRYHSLIVEKENFPACLSVTAASEEGEIMALEHIAYPTYGVQFHPESILTPLGKQIIKNFLRCGTFHEKQSTRG